MDGQEPEGGFMADDENRSATGDERLDRVITDYLEAVAAGKEPSRGELLARYPDLATYPFFPYWHRRHYAVQGF